MFYIVWLAVILKEFEKQSKKYKELFIDPTPPQISTCHSVTHHLVFHLCHSLCCWILCYFSDANSRSTMLMRADTSDTKTSFHATTVCEAAAVTQVVIRHE